MKVLEPQSALLTNYEVFQHLVDQRRQYALKKRRGPPNLETVVRELLEYLRTQPSPLSQEPTTYSPQCISQLLERLRPYDLSKGEVVMILNLRPASVVALNTVIEHMDDRFDSDQQEEMVSIIAHVLGQFVVGGEAQQQGTAGDMDVDDAAAT